jgi:hypothetical protein
VLQEEGVVSHGEEGAERGMTEKLKQITYKVALLDGSAPVQFDVEREARNYALELMATGVSAYLTRQTSELISLFDAAARKEEVLTRR